MRGRVVIIMGSERDLNHVNKIVAQLEGLGVGYALHVASAHKTVRHLLHLLAHYGEDGQPTVFVAVAGRSNALAGMIDANTVCPVITCPPVSATFGGADIYSSLRMPSGVAPTVILEPEGAALAGAKILALSDPDLRGRISAYQAQMSNEVLSADESLST